MAVGIIAEFNPFHNGHKYLLESAKNQDGIVVIMSGSFVQRGDTAITDKWTRARAALDNGADLVIELPVIYSLNTAQKFAYGAIETLYLTGVVDKIAFGCETEDKDELIKAAELINDEPLEISCKIKEYMSQGMNYPTARGKAYVGVLKRETLSSPNNILAVEYIRAMLSCGMDAEILPVQRKGVGHDSTVTEKDIASASEIRRIIRSGRDISRFVPQGEQQYNLYNSKILETAIIAKIRQVGEEYIRNINDVSEGLENRFFKAAGEMDNLEDLCNFVKSKRYTHSRIRRIVWSILLGFTKELAQKSPEYIRILGMNDTGKRLLKTMKKTAKLTIITKAADFRNNEIFLFNNRAEDLFALCSTDESMRKCGRDIATTPVIV